MILESKTFILLLFILFALCFVLLKEGYASDFLFHEELLTILRIHCVYWLKSSFTVFLGLIINVQ